MKKIFSILFALAATVSVYAQSEPDTMYVYADNRVDSIAIADIDSVLFTDWTVSEILAAEAITNLADGETTADYYIVRGVVSNVAQVNLSYGNANFYITDGTQELYCYQTFGLNNEKFVHGSQVAVGDSVIVYSRIKNYQGIIEPMQGYLLRTTNDFDPSIVEGPQEITVAEAIEIGSALASGETTPDQYILTGMVTEVTNSYDNALQYGNWTFHIQDTSSETTFYCYRLRYLDNQKYTSSDPVLEVGDTVKLLGSIQNYKGTTLELVNGYFLEHVK